MDNYGNPRNKVVFLFKYLFVIFFIYYTVNIAFLWKEYKDLLRDLLFSVALTSALWFIMIVFITLLVWCIWKMFEYFLLKMGRNVRIEQFLLYSGIFILIISLSWIIKKSILPDLHMTFKLKSLVIVIGAFISLFPTRLLHEKTERLLNMVQRRITPFIWLFGIIVILSVPPTIYIVWQEIRLYSSDNLHNRDLHPLVTFVFDDNYEKIYTRAKPIFDAKGEVACAAIVLDYIDKPGRMTIEQIRELQKGGWEILSHSVTHPDLTTLTREEVENELRKSKSGLEDLGFEIYNFVYPFYRHNAVVRMAARKYYRSARSGDQWKSGLNVNPHILRMYALSAVELESSKQFRRLIKYIDYAEANNYWLIIVMHNVHPNIERMLNSLIDYIQSKDIKIVTINQALDLIGERKESKMSRYLFILNNDSPGDIFRILHIVTQKILSKFQDLLLNFFRV